MTIFYHHAHSQAQASLILHISSSLNDIFVVIEYVCVCVLIYMITKVKLWIVKEGSHIALAYGLYKNLFLKT